MIWLRAAVLFAFVALGWFVGPTLAHDVAGCSDQGYSNGNDNQSHGGGSQLRCGLRGNDNMDGGGGDDGLDGDEDDDDISGGETDDHVFGDDGDDFLHGDDGNDTVEGGNGNDLMFGDDGNDTMDGGRGRDEQHGEDGDDIFLVRAGDIQSRRKETLDGGRGSDEALFDFDPGFVGCKKKIKDPDTNGKYRLKSIANCLYNQAIPSQE